MHYSAKRGLAIAFYPSDHICLCVTFVDCDHIGWKSWKLIAGTISTTPLNFDHRGHSPTPRGKWGIWGRLAVRRGSRCWAGL